jgi:hypothetical protein
MRKHDFDRDMSWYIFDAFLYTVDAYDNIFYFRFGFQYVSHVLVSIWGGLCPMLQRSSASCWDKWTE